MKNNISSRIRGAMYGVAVGDALGAPLEFMDAIRIQMQHGTVRDMIGGGWLGVRPGEFTDDTQMTLAVAHGIAEESGDPIEAIGRHFVSWANSGPKDVGATCASSIHRAMRTAKNPASPSKNDWLDAAAATHTLMHGRSAGNGSLMRTAYVGLYYKSEHEAMQKAMQISKMTHYDEETAVDCAVYSAILNRMVDESSFRIRKQLLIHYACRSAYCKGRYPYDLLSCAGYTPRPTGYVVDSFAAALHCILTTDSFEEAVIKAVNLGGDADTIGAITGGLAGALYGYEAIPERWTKCLASEDCAELDTLCEVAALR